MNMMDDCLHLCLYRLPRWCAIARALASPHLASVIGTRSAIQLFQTNQLGKKNSVSGIFLQDCFYSKEAIKQTLVLFKANYQRQLSRATT